MARSARRQFRRGRSSSWPAGWSGRSPSETQCPRSPAVSASSCLDVSFRLLKAREAFGTEPAGRAFAAAVAPVVAPRTVAEIAAMSVLDQHVEKRVTAQFDCQREGFGLVDPHQWGVHREIAFHPEVERLGHGL